MNIEIENARNIKAEIFHEDDFIIVSYENGTIGIFDNIGQAVNHLDMLSRQEETIQEEL